MVALHVNEVPGPARRRWVRSRAPATSPGPSRMRSDAHDLDAARVLGGGQHPVAVGRQDGDRGATGGGDPRRDLVHVTLDPADLRQVPWRDHQYAKLALARLCARGLERSIHAHSAAITCAEAPRPPAARACGVRTSFKVIPVHSATMRVAPPAARARLSAREPPRRCASTGMRRP